VKNRENVEIDSNFLKKLVRALMELFSKLLIIQMDK
jgi:DNA-directed RNA polymerase subunit K/omega